MSHYLSIRKQFYNEGLRSAGADRFTFNGQERTDEIAGMGNHNTALFWEYDTRLGRRWNLDPKITIGVSDYSVLYNNPVLCVDIFGDKPSPRQAAAMAVLAYKDPKNKAANEKALKILKRGGWKISSQDFSIEKDKKENGLKSEVFERTKNGITEYAYATAGTDDWADFPQDIGQPAGLSSQYDLSMRNAITISNKLGKQFELTFTGHSLGGGEAAANAYATGRDAITFNAAGVSKLTIKPNKDSQVDAYIMRTDPLNAIQNNNFSSLGYLMPDVNGTRHYVWPRSIPALYNGHSIDNILMAVPDENIVQFKVVPYKSGLDNFYLPPLVIQPPK